MGAQFHKADPVGLEFTFRALPSGVDVFEGYSAVFNKESKVLRDHLARTPAGYREVIRPGAFARSIRTTNRKTFVVDHNERQMITETPNGPLRLSEDSTGLHVESPWPRTPWTDTVRSLKDVGNKLGMSIFFGSSPRHEAKAWSADGSLRTITEGVIRHVTVLATMEPAYEETVGTPAFRALADLMEADVEDIEDLIDALREQRRLSDSEWNLAARMLDTVKPEAPEPTPQPDAGLVLPDTVRAMLDKIAADLPQS